METEIDSSVFSYFTFFLSFNPFYLLSFISLALPFFLVLPDAMSLLSTERTLFLRPHSGRIGLGPHWTKLLKRILWITVWNRWHTNFLWCSTGRSQLILNPMKCIVRFQSKTVSIIIEYIWNLTNKPGTVWMARAPHVLAGHKDSSLIP